MILLAALNLCGILSWGLAMVAGQPGATTMAIDIHLGYLSLQVGSWDILWSHHAREFVVCKGMRTMVHWKRGAR
jgi:hypothetical protein